MQTFDDFLNPIMEFDLFASRNRRGNINTKASEFGARVTPDGKYLFFQRNGSVNILPSSRVPYTINMHGNFNNYDDGANYNMIMYLNSGQYCSLAVRWHANGNSRHHAGHQIFSGQLIG